MVLAGVELRSDVDVIRWPDRFADDRGRTMWETVSQLLAEFKRLFSVMAVYNTRDRAQGRA